MTSKPSPSGVPTKEQIEEARDWLILIDRNGDHHNDRLTALCDLALSAIQPAPQSEAGLVDELEHTAKTYPSDGPMAIPRELLFRAARALRARGERGWR